jgi:steroid 5-alpha reductase family enzyme
MTTELAIRFASLSAGFINSYLLYRIVKIGKDDRFDEMRDSIVKFGIFWFLQFVTVWVCFLPETLMFSNPAPAAYESFSLRDGFGFGMFALGWCIEVAADQQKFDFKNDSKNKGHWCDKGLWSWSRHPNYFGEIVLWWGLFVVCSTTFVDAPWKYFSVVGPAFLTRW